jgi:hypothetical protein
MMLLRSGVFVVALEKSRFLQRWSKIGVTQRARPFARTVSNDVVTCDEVRLCAFEAE